MGISARVSAAASTFFTELRCETAVLGPEACSFGSPSAAAGGPGSACAGDTRVPDGGAETDPPVAPGTSVATGAPHARHVVASVGSGVPQVRHVTNQAFGGVSGSAPV